MNCFIVGCCVILVASTIYQVEGASCSCNCNDGGSNCPGNHYLRAQRSIKQCVFSKLNDERDDGSFSRVMCVFKKAESHTSLRVTFNGDMRMVGCPKGCCRRWFITINGAECRDPATIDTQIYATGTSNRHSPKTLDGFCNNVPRGTVTVGLSISACPGVSPGNAYTGWQSVSRFVIEEVPPLQS